MKTLGIIPARFKSSRYPGKPLVSLWGKPMILWVAELTAKALGKESVVIATEDQRIVSCVEEAGFTAVMTGDDLLTGTDRVAEVATKISADIYINIQGDEPTLDPSIIHQVLETKIASPQHVICAMTQLKSYEDPANVNLPKVITTEDHQLVYMSRLPIPGTKSVTKDVSDHRKQVCVYAFSGEELKSFSGFGRKSQLEAMEDIEILRFLELDVPVKMVEIDYECLAVDVPEDVEPVEKRLSEIHGH